MMTTASFRYVNRHSRGPRHNDEVQKLAPNTVGVYPLCSVATCSHCGIPSPFMGEGALCSVDSSYIGSGYSRGEGDTEMTIEWGYNPEWEDFLGREAEA